MIRLTDKKGLLKQFKENQLNKSLTMFEWQNLPDTVPMVELEKMLQINGYAIIAKYKGELYAFQGGFTGQDAYSRPTQVIVNNPALQMNETYTIDDDCIIIKNDDMKQGLIKIYEYFGQRLIENQITMLMTDYNLRMPFTISSSDDQTTQSAKDYLNKIIDGSLGVIGEQKLFKALSVTPTNTKQTATFADLYGYQQFIIAQLNNTIGLATNNNMKRERLTTNEIEINKNASYPLVDNMLRNRQQAVEKLNKMFGLNIIVEYSSIWGTDNNDSKVNEKDNNSVDTRNSLDVDNNDSKVNENDNNSVDTRNSLDVDNNKPVASGEDKPEENEEASEENEPEATKEDTPEASETEEIIKDVPHETDTQENEADKPNNIDNTDSNDENNDNTTSGDDNKSTDDKKEKEHDKK